MARPEPVAAVIGGGPAGLMAAEILALRGIRVDLYDAMPSVGRKFLLAGRGGLNLTHAEPTEAFLSRYGSRRGQVADWLSEFGPEQVRAWASDLGIATFVGTSGRVFPTGMKAAPLLRAWLHRLRTAGVQFHVRHRLLGWSDDRGKLHFATPHGETVVEPQATVLALGGGSWQRFGSDGAWVRWMRQSGIRINPLRPANCGFNVAWSTHMKRHAGKAVKNVAAHVESADAGHSVRQGEFIVTESGVEGGLIYAVSAQMRDQIDARGHAMLTLDLAPDRSIQRLSAELAKPRGRDSLANHLRRRCGIDGVRATLLREFSDPGHMQDMASLATSIKSLPMRLESPRPLDEAISSAGGIDFVDLDEHLMLRNRPGTFCAGEMLDWEAPTGGYLLTACLAAGRKAGLGASRWLEAQATCQRR